MKNLVYILISLFGFHNIHGQCFEPDDKIWKNTWESCSKSQNPKTEYGSSHWLMYDLSVARKLSKTWVWNSNDPQKLNAGFKTVKIDHSNNGNDWEYWGEMTFPRANGDTVYAGFHGPDLSGIEAQFVLITVVDNYGNQCAGIAEIKFNLLPDNGTVDGGTDNESCAAIEEIELVELFATEAYIMWEYDGEVEVEDFIFSYREQGSIEWIELLTDEPSIFIEGLDPNISYEYTISYYCDDALSSSMIFIFTTPEGENEEENEECVAVEIIDLVPEENGVYLAWNGQEGLTYEVFIKETEADEEEIEDYYVEEVDIYIDDLEPNTSYQVAVGYDCGDDFYLSEIHEFTTGDNSTSTRTARISLNDESIHAIPNPFMNQLRLSYLSNTNELINVYLHDIAGKRVYAEQFKVSIGENTRVLHLDHLQAGQYFIQVVGLSSRMNKVLKVVCVN